MTIGFVITLSDIFTLFIILILTIRIESEFCKMMSWNGGTLCDVMCYKKLRLVKVLMFLSRVGVFGSMLLLIATEASVIVSGGITLFYSLIAYHLTRCRKDVCGWPERFF